MGARWGSSWPVADTACRGGLEIHQLADCRTRLTLRAHLEELPAAGTRTDHADALFRIGPQALFERLPFCQET